MWLTELAVLAVDAPAPEAPPEIPFQTVGIILVSMVTGITGVIVALIQRGKNKPAEVPVTGGGTTVGPVFVVSKEDWDKFREAVTRLDTQFQQLRSDYDYHERLMVGEVRTMSNEVAYMKGQLGLRNTQQ